MTGTWREDQFRFLSVCRLIFAMKNVSHKSCTENQITHFMFNNFFFFIFYFVENSAVYEIT